MGFLDFFGLSGGGTSALNGVKKGIGTSAGWGSFFGPFAGSSLGLGANIMSMTMAQDEAHKENVQKTNAVALAGSVSNMIGDGFNIANAISDDSVGNTGSAKNAGIASAGLAMASHGLSAIGEGVMLGKSLGGAKALSFDKAKDIKNFFGALGGTVGLAGNVASTWKAMRQYSKAKALAGNDPEKLKAAKSARNRQLAGTFFSALGNSGKILGSLAKGGSDAKFAGQIMGAVGQGGSILYSGLGGMYRAGRSRPTANPNAANVANPANPANPVNPAPPGGPQNVVPQGGPPVVGAANAGVQPVAGAANAGVQPVPGAQGGPGGPQAVVPGGQQNAGGPVAGAQGVQPAANNPQQMVAGLLQVGNLPPGLQQALLQYQQQLAAPQQPVVPQVQGGPPQQPGQQGGPPQQLGQQGGPPQQPVAQVPVVGDQQEHRVDANPNPEEGGEQPEVPEDEEGGDDSGSEGESDSEVDEVLPVPEEGEHPDEGGEQPEEEHSEVPGVRVVPVQGASNQTPPPGLNRRQRRDWLRERGLL